MDSYCNYDYTSNTAQLPQFMYCLPDIKDVQEQGNVVLDVPDQGIVREYNAAQAAEDLEEIETVPDEELVNEEDGATENDESKNEAILDTTESKRSNACFTRRSLFISSVFLCCCVIFLLIVIILRSLRVEPGTGSDAMLVSEPYVLGDSSSGRPLGAWSTDQALEEDGLRMEGEICEEHDQCKSGLCGGSTIPYSCQPQVRGCQPCYQDRNCLSGICVLRSGQSICASTVDGQMDLGCFCDVDEQCNSRRCEGEFPEFTCQGATTFCILDSDCSNGICNDGQCSNHQVGNLGSKESLGGRCSVNTDCSSRLCVGFSSGLDGVCSSGEIGSICATSADCESERCSQGLCKTKQVPGGPCKGNFECASGICIGFSASNNGLCLDTSSENMCDTEGGPCGRSGRCVGGFCKSFSLMRGAVCIEDADCLSAACIWSPLRAERICG